jgi:hypothetical protein
MRKASTQFSTPGLKPPSLTRTLKHFDRNAKKPIDTKKPVAPTEEIVDRLNDIGKTYPFCVYYKSQTNDPL